MGDDFWLKAFTIFSESGIIFNTCNKPILVVREYIFYQIVILKNL